MKRSDKIRAVTRYLVSRTGIPLISWDGNGNALNAPHGYGFTVSTDASLNRFFDYAKKCETDKVDVVIRYDSFLNEVDRSIVGMPLSTFTKLLEAYHSAQGQPKGE